MKKTKILNIKMSGIFRNSKFEIRNYRKGFTLLFAALVGGLLFSVGVAMANLAMRELALASAGRESQFAFYAADSGAECALYWDRQENKFPAAVGTVPPFLCAGKSITADRVVAITGGAKTSFTLPLLGSACAKVDVSKTGATQIESRGRNDCGASDNPGRVERAIRVRY